MTFSAAKKKYVCQEIEKERLWEEIEIGDFVHIPLKWENIVEE